MKDELEKLKRNLAEQVVLKRKMLLVVELPKLGALRTCEQDKSPHQMSNSKFYPYKEDK